MSTAIATGRTLRPLRHLPWRSTAAGNIALFAPGGAIAIGLSIIDGRPMAAAAVAAVVLAATAFIVIPALRIRTRLDADGITTFWTRRRFLHVDRDQVSRAVVRTIYNGDGISTNRHLFLLDDEDRAIFRMSSRWWTDEQLLTVAHHFSVPLDSQPHPVHLAEVRRTAPDQLRWSERHRVLAVGGTIAGGFLICLAFAWLVTAAI
ncbi:hypothetical protein [uncultured Amnibacterium sp.]|uniref:hypothetical protein n=1 Tax=uncultured Amnibacterium sp. TaxID=1631851 RepID=UPI0035CAF0DF